MKTFLMTKRGKAGAVLAVMLFLSLVVQIVQPSFTWGQWFVAAIVWLALIWLIIRKEIRYAGMDTEQKWNTWNDCHATTDQLRRIQRACEESYNIKYEDTVRGTALFIGGSGKYNASLIECSCPDFKKRRLPCKHMYKLAIDMKLLEADYEEGED